VFNSKWSEPVSHKFKEELDALIKKHFPEGSGNPPLEVKVVAVEKWVAVCERYCEADWVRFYDKMGEWDGNIDVLAWVKISINPDNSKVITVLEAIHNTQILRSRAHV
jgi:hypothetical protein